MTYGYIKHEVKKIAMTVAKSEACIGWFCENCYLVEEGWPLVWWGRNESLVVWCGGTLLGWTYSGDGEDKENFSC